MRLLRLRRPLLWRAFRVVAAVADERLPQPADEALALLEKALALRLTRTERIRLLTALGFLRQQTALLEGDYELLLASIAPLEAAADLAVPDHEEAVAASMNHAVGLSAVFEVTGGEEERDGMLRAARRSRELLVPGQAVTADVLHNLAEFLVRAYEAHAEPDLLREALEAARDLAAVDENAWRPLAVVLRMLYEEGQDTGHLEEARACAQTAAARTGKPEDWAELAHIHRLEHGESGAIEAARAAAAAARRAVELTEDDDDLGRHRVLLAGALLDCHQSGDESALDEAVTAARSALSGEDAHEDFVICQTAAVVLSTYGMRNGDRAVLTEAEKAAQAAVDEAADSESRAIALDTLASIQEHHYVLTADPGLLDRAIETGWSAVRQDASNRHDRAGHLGNLASLIEARYELRGDRADLDLAVDLGREAIALTSEGHPDRGIYLNNLGIALHHRYELADGETDLKEAIVSGREAVELSPEGHVKAIRLTNLGTTLGTAYERRGDPADLDESVRCHREAVDAVPRGDGDRPGLLHNLGTALRRRHGLLGSAADLGEAAVAMREAIETSSRASESAFLREGYALTLSTLAAQSGDASYRRQAIEESRAALAATGADHPLLPYRLANLVTLLDGDGSATAAEAVEAARRSIAVLPAGHFDLPAIRSTLALALSARGADGDLDEAVAEATAAVESAPDGPDRCQLLVNQALILRRRAAEHGADQDALAALAVLRQAARSTLGPPVLRLRAAWEWGRMAAERGDVADGAEGMETAVRLMPVVSPERLERSDAERMLAEVAGLPEAAASLFLASGRPERAVEMLELGRGVLLHRVLRMRDDLAGVEAVDGGLAERFRRLRRRIDVLAAEDGTARPVLPAGRMAPPGSVHLGLAVAHRHERRRELAEELRDVVGRIRQSRELEHFLSPVPIADLLAEARSGPVALVNVSAYRCDALLLTSGGVHPVRLPDLREAELEERALQFHQEVLRAHTGETEEECAEAERKLTDMLDWLWRTVASPVLTELDLRDPGHSRIWWVPTAALSFLPLHAAMAADGGDSVLDRVVSLYTPTLTALRHGRRRPAPDRPGTPVVLYSAGAGEHGGVPVGALPWAKEEAERVAARYGVPPLDASVRSRSDLLARIGSCSDLHASMHARSDPDDPSRGALLAGPDAELTVTDIAARHNTGANLAYLSACETALGTLGLADEAVHLTGAFQLAGFKHTVGTFWEVRDAVADRASLWFYDALDRLGSADLAVHEASHRLRARYRGRPSAWAAHHYTGIG